MRWDVGLGELWDGVSVGHEVVSFTDVCVCVVHWYVVCVLCACRPV